jgi:hypothetical protein
MHKQVANFVYAYMLLHFILCNVWFYLNAKRELKII